MASVAASCLCSIRRVQALNPSATHHSSARIIHCAAIPKSRSFSVNGFQQLPYFCEKQQKNRFEFRRLRSAEDETALTEQVEAETQTQETVSVPVSPSDKLTMFFQADGTMNETAIPVVTKALEATEGISNLKVQVSEGIATVELMKQTTVQATAVASSLVEIIQGAGFKLQTLNLSFEDEEEAAFV